MMRKKKTMPKIMQRFNIKKIQILMLSLLSTCLLTACVDNLLGRGPGTGGTGPIVATPPPTATPSNTPDTGGNSGDSLKENGSPKLPEMPTPTAPLINIVPNKAVNIRISTTSQPVSLCEGLQRTVIVKGDIPENNNANNTSTNNTSANNANANNAISDIAANKYLTFKTVVKNTLDTQATEVQKLCASYEVTQQSNKKSTILHPKACNTANNEITYKGKDEQQYLTQWELPKTTGVYRVKFINLISNAYNSGVCIPPYIDFEITQP